MTKIEGYSNYCITKEGDVWSNFTNKFLKKTKSGRGYYQVFLYENGKMDVCVIHRCVAKTFILNKDNKEYVNHIDGNKLNNQVSNLEWCTHKENMQHAWETGLIKISQKHRDSASKRAMAKVGDKNYGSKKVINILTGKIHVSIKEAWLERGGSRSYLSEVLSGKKINNTPYDYYTSA